MWGPTGIYSWTVAIFNIYINDPNNSTSNLSTILFVDDTNLFCSGKNLKELEWLINEELAHVQEWLMLNKLTLNVKKNQLSLFSNLIKGN